MAGPPSPPPPELTAAVLAIRKYADHTLAIGRVRDSWELLRHLFSEEFFERLHLMKPRKWTPTPPGYGRRPRSSALSPPPSLLLNDKHAAQLEAIRKKEKRLLQIAAINRRLRLIEDEMTESESESVPIPTESRSNKRMDSMMKTERS